MGLAHCLSCAIETIENELPEEGVSALITTVDDFAAVVVGFYN